MKLLLDTHFVLWWLEDAPTLSVRARRVIADGRNRVAVSAVVIWEIRFKAALGKLTLPEDFREALETQRFDWLAITAPHAHEVGTLPPHHQDPFDRMLVAQARVEGLTLVTRDPQFNSYGIPLLGA